MGDPKTEKALFHAPTMLVLITTVKKLHVHVQKYWQCISFGNAHCYNLNYPPRVYTKWTEYRGDVGSQYNVASKGV